MTGSSSFLYNAAELKRFRSHPLSSADPGQAGRAEASITEDLIRDVLDTTDVIRGGNLEANVAGMHGKRHLQSSGLRTLGTSHAVPCSPNLGAVHAEHTVTTGNVPCVGRALLVASAAESGLEETCLPPPVVPAPAVQRTPHTSHVLPELDVRTCSWLGRSLELQPSSGTCILCGGHMAGQMLPTSFQDLRAYLSDSPA